MRKTIIVWKLQNILVATGDILFRNAGELCRCSVKVPSSVVNDFGNSGGYWFRTSARETKGEMFLQNVL